ncbi:sigma-70 family RNA polymerase sigma factor [Micromonospora sp. WMMD714]|uniref:RNA polymerase sigma factor n=1 Tax=Micromonospora sp. WMMD714 TaxID=3016097 RepID=UPI00249C171D|nr:sigma-70 family RNA polymerase sigma factor [Micromonospora sp. WMMD714]WFE62799.1 sigma-70 family RNA polymerase sigma factor [Micromonospora sp. WMMD714]
MDVTTLDDRALVEALRRGDRVGLEGIYRRYADRLYTYARVLLREPEAAADAVHDAFLLASQRIDQLRDPDRLRSWLYAIVRTECLRQLRERSRSEPLTEVAEPVADTADPAAAVNADQVRDLVHLAVAALNPGDREVVHLAIRHDLSSADIGAALGVPANHAHARLSRARSQLERALGALLVARGGARDCPALADLLDDWQGRLTPTLRKRVARHIDDCARCGLLRREQCNPAALLTAYTAPGFLVVADAVWPRLADADPAIGQAAGPDPAAGTGSAGDDSAAGPDPAAGGSTDAGTADAGGSADAAGPGEIPDPAGPVGASDGRAETPPSSETAAPPADSVVARDAPQAAAGGRVVHAVPVAASVAAVTPGDTAAAGTANGPGRPVAATAGPSARRRDRRRLAGLLVLLLLLLLGAGTWALSTGGPTAEQAAVTSGELSGGASSPTAPTGGAAPQRSASPSGPAGAGAPATAVPPPTGSGPPTTAVPPAGAPPVPAPTGSPAAPHPPAALPLAVPFTVTAKAHVRCGADTWSLVVRATGSATLGTARMRWTPAGGRAASRAMTVDGASAQLTVGGLGASAVTWSVRVTGTDGRTADSPSTTTTDPCVRPG